MDLYVIGIEQRYDNETVLGFVNEYNTHYPTASGINGGGSKVFSEFQIPYTPSLVLIAPDHSIVEQAVPRPTVAQDLIDLLETYNFSVSGLGDEISKEKVDFSFFPNPVESTIQINVKEGLKIDQLKIYQLTGQEVISKSISQYSAEYSYDVSFLQRGIYLLSLDFENGERVSKSFIKK